MNDNNGKILLRIAMSGVFLWFGYHQLIAPDGWTTLVPEFVSNIVSAKTVVLLNGWFEVIAGLMLLVGFQVRVVSLLLGLHLLGIAASFGLSNAIGIRDFGLTFATLAVFLSGPDSWTLDTKLSLKTENRV